MQNKNQSLSQSFRFLTLFVLMMMSVGSVCGETTYTFTSKAWADATNSWTSDKDAYQFSSPNVQITSAYSGAGATSKSSFTNISKISIKASTTSKGVGNITVKVGDGSAQTICSLSKNTTATWYALEYATPVSGKVTFVVNCSTNSMYVQAIEITTDTETYSVTYNANSATSGNVPTDENKYKANTSVTVLGNTGNLVRDGYTFGGWNTKDDGTGTNYQPGGTFNISANTTLYAKWNEKEISSLAISGNVTKTSYKVGETLNPNGLKVTATYNDNTTADVTNDVEWTFDPETFTEIGNNLTCNVTATIGEVSSSPYSVAELTVKENTDKIITYNFNDANAYPSGFPTSGTNPASAKEFTISGNKIIINAPTSYYVIQSADNNKRGLFYGKSTSTFSSTAYLGFPAQQGYKLTKVVATSTDGVAKDVVINVYDTKGNEMSASITTQSGATVGKQSYTFELSDSKGNTEYRLATLTKDKNLQFDNIVLTYEKLPTYDVTVSTPENGILQIQHNSIAITSGDEFGENTILDVVATPSSGYELDAVKVVKTGVSPEADVTSSVYNSSTNKLTMPKYAITVSATFKTAIERKDPTIVIDSNFDLLSGNSLTLVKDDNYMIDDDYDGTIVLSTTDNSKVSIDGLTMTGYAQGVATITITAPQTSTYTEASKTFTIKVSPIKRAIVSKYHGQYYAAVPSVTNKVLAVTPVLVMDGKVINYEGSDDVKWYICKSATGYTIQDKDEKYLSNSSTDIALDASVQSWTIDAGGIITSDNRTPMYRASANGMKAYTTSNAGTSDYGDKGLIAGFEVKEESETKYCRAVNAANIGTLCVPYEFTKPSTMTLYKIVGKDDNNIYFEEDEEEVTVAGRPYLFRSTDANLVLPYVGDAAGNAGTSNGLVGTFAECDITAGDNNYVISSNKLYIVDGDFTCGANRAYIHLAGIEGGAPDAGVKSAFALDFSDPTNIRVVEFEELNDGASYNLAGQAVGRDYKGVVIKNGKKYINK